MKQFFHLENFPIDSMLNERSTSDYIFQMKDVKRLKSFSHLTIEIGECYR